MINILGMAIAIACCTVAFYLHDFNATFDSQHVRGGSTYRISSIRTYQNTHTKYGHAPLALGSFLLSNRGYVEHVARYSSGTLSLRVNDLLYNDVVGYVDPEFFDLFSFQPLYGSLSLDQPTTMLISDELARKYFGKVDVVGEEMVQLLGNGKQHVFTVGGVFVKQPANSSFGLQAYVHFSNQRIANPTFAEDDWAPRALTYVSIADEEQVRMVENDLKKFTQANNLAREDFQLDRFVLDRFSGLAVRDTYNNTRGIWTNSAAHISAIMGTAVMGIFILLIACFNLTNTSIAIAAGRLKEIGIRKVMGGGKKGLIVQHLGEICLISLVALLLGLVIADTMLIPAFNSLWTFWAFTPDYFGKPDYVIFLLVVFGLTTLLAGSYPAFYISRFQAVQVLKGKVKFGGTNFLTKTLVTLQLSISLIAVVCSLAFIANARYQQTLDLGFDKDEVVFTEIQGELEFDALKNSMMGHANVLSVAAAHHHLGASYFNDPVKSGDKELEVDIVDVGDDYLKTVGLRLLAGRDFISDSESDKLHAVIITESLAEAFAWTAPLGEEIIWMDTVHYRVIGVVENIVNKGMMNEMDPVMLRYQGNARARYCVVRAPLDKIMDVKSTLEAEAKLLFPDRLTTVKYMNELVANSLQINSSILNMFLFLGIVATFLSATGLYTLTSLHIIKRMKEIGVRKILGATGGNIARIINKEFVIILGIASVLGGYLGAFLSGMLLDSIWEHFQRASLATIMLSIVTLVIISCLSIAYKIIRTIRINPTTILRNE